MTDGWREQTEAGLTLPIAFVAFCYSKENFATEIQKMLNESSLKIIKNNVVLLQY
jgi:hypothetical protein